MPKTMCKSATLGDEQKWCSEQSASDVQEEPDCAVLPLTFPTDTHLRKPVKRKRSSYATAKDDSEVQSKTKKATLHVWDYRIHSPGQFGSTFSKPGKLPLGLAPPSQKLEDFNLNNLASASLPNTRRPLRGARRPLPCAAAVATKASYLWALARFLPR